DGTKVFVGVNDLTPLQDITTLGRAEVDGVNGRVRTGIDLKTFKETHDHEGRIKSGRYPKSLADVGREPTAIQHRLNDETVLQIRTRKAIPIPELGIRATGDIAIHGVAGTAGVEGAIDWEWNVTNEGVDACDVVGDVDVAWDDHHGFDESSQADRFPDMSPILAEFAESLVTAIPGGTTGRYMRKFWSFFRKLAAASGDSDDRNKIESREYHRSGTISEWLEKAQVEVAMRNSLSTSSALHAVGINWGGLDSIDNAAPDLTRSAQSSLRSRIELKFVAGGAPLITGAESAIGNTLTSLPWASTPPHWDLRVGPPEPTADRPQGYSWDAAIRFDGDVQATFKRDDPAFSAEADLNKDGRIVQTSRSWKAAETKPA
ncbi:MAG: hypothetical protein AAF078_10725, partial [Planctomycetota bacterium]